MLDDSTLYDLNGAVYQYLLLKFPKNASSFLQEANNKINLNLKEENILIKKWNAIVNLQLRLMDLQNQITDLRKQLEIYQKKSRYDETYFDLLSDTPWFEFNDISKPVNSILFHPFLSLLVCGCDDYTIRIIDFEKDNNNQVILNGHECPIHSLAFSSHGDLLASGASDSIIIIWDFILYKQKHILNGHMGSIWSLKFLDDEKLISSSKDTTLKIWDLKNQSVIHTIYEHNEWVRCVTTYSINDLKLFATSGNDRRIIVWKSSDFSIFMEMDNKNEHTHVIESLCFANEKMLSYLLENLFLVTRIDKNLVNEVEESSNFSKKKRNYEKGIILFSASRDLLIKMWDVCSGKNLNTYKGHTNWVRFIQIHPSGKHIISCSDDKSIILFDVITCAIVKQIKCAHNNFIFSLHVNTKLKLLCSCSLNGSIKLWKLGTEENKKV